MDRGAWWVTVHGGHKKSDMTVPLKQQQLQAVKRSLGSSMWPLRMQEDGLATLLRAQTQVDLDNLHKTVCVSYLCLCPTGHHQTQRAQR